MKDQLNIPSVLQQNVFIVSMVYNVLHHTRCMYIGVLKLLLEESSQSVNSQLFLEMQADILLVISCICELDVHRKVSLLGGTLAII